MGRALIITTGGGTDVEEGNPNVGAGQVLAGYTVYGKTDDPIRGTMPTQWANGGTKSLDPGGSLVLPSGYYTGTFSCKAVALSDKTSASATAAQVLKDKTGWKSGSKITGTMVSIGTRNGTISANGTYTVPVGWHNGSGKVTQSLSTQAATNVTPGTAQKTVIAASKWSTGNQVVLGNGNLVAGNIKNEVTIFGIKGSFGIGSVRPYAPLWTNNSNTPSYNAGGNVHNSENGYDLAHVYQDCYLNVWKGWYSWRNGSARVSAFQLWVRFNPDKYKAVRFIGNLESSTQDYNTAINQGFGIDCRYYDKVRNTRVSCTTLGSLSPWRPDASTPEQRWRFNFDNYLFYVPDSQTTRYTPWTQSNTMPVRWVKSDYTAWFYATGTNFYIDFQFIYLYPR